MIQKRSIFPFILLVAFSMMLAHGLIPHQHEVSLTNSSVDIHERDRTPEHPHPHPEGSKLPLLHWLIGFMDAHQDSEDDSHHELVYTTSSLNQFQFDLGQELQVFLPPLTEYQEQIFVSFPLLVLEPLNRCNSDPPNPSVWSHRGPPALG